jgi:hypothetical protein
MKRNIIWNNDVCEMEKSIRECPSDFFEAEDVSDEDVWEMAYSEIERNLDDEESNLSIKVPGTIIMTGSLQRWDGSRNAYKELKTNNIGKAIREAVMSFDGDNSFEIYEEDGKLMLSQTGHDNPCNPSIFEFKRIDEAVLEETDNVEKESYSIGSLVSEVYGWVA